ncbi:MAG: EAL domain-containing protein [Gemmatimonadetes bacterium]|nr:EAL domain-containing protein [Gemmatimonadota bacterium]
MRIRPSRPLTAAVPGTPPDSLLEREGLYALAARGANDGLWEWNLGSGEVHYSSRWKALLGHHEHEIGGTIGEWLHRVHPDDIAQLQATMEEHLDGRSDFLQHEHRLLHKTGCYRWFFVRGVASRGENGRARRVAGSLTDISERRLAEAQLLHEELHDGLTGLPNRRVFVRVLERAMRRLERQPDHLFAVLYLDLDRFTVVNDSLGHAAGDRLLVAIASRLQECVRPGDVLARPGGDEFIVLLNEVKDAADTVRVGERIQHSIRAPFRLESGEVFTSASIGIAVGTAGEERAEHLLRDAHTATMRAKARGGARYEMFDPALHERAVARLRLETDLRRAVERDEFRLRYQPIVSLDTRRVVGFEALVRWAHPERGVVSPMEFIPIAEETGLVVPLGWWVIKEATRQVRAWHDRFAGLEDLCVSVNVSPRQFQQPDLAERLRTVAQEAGAPLACLKLEITENVLMDDPGATFTTIEKLRGAGVKVDIDDFGTGYSSLSYLHRLPVDGLKIDRSFVAGLDDGNGSSEIVKAIISLARTLGLRAVAEGVETETQAARLATLGCGHAQGYLFEKPLEADAADDLLLRQLGTPGHRGDRGLATPSDPGLQWPQAALDALTLP